MKKIELFGRELNVNNSFCLENLECECEKKPTLSLYIKVTDSCNANCEFCANKGCENYGKIDLVKLKETIKYLKDERILGNISITGGEPNTYPLLLNDIINLILEVDKKIKISISTNGFNIREMALFDQVNSLESIHISRHHYLDSENNKIFKDKKVAQTDDIIYLQSKLDDKKIININTMVMKNHIDNLNEIKKMLNYVGNINVYKNGFVSLMKVNDYSNEHFINFNDIFNNLDDNFFLGHHFYNKKYCECVDGMYVTDNNRIVEFYARMVKEAKENNVVQQLVYTSDNMLTAGFSGKILCK